MLKIECDNQELIRELTRLATNVEKAGAFFHPALTLKVEKGNFYFVSNIPSDNEIFLISIPAKAFIPLSDIKFKLDGSKIVVSEGLDRLDSKAKERLEITLRIYNLSNKIEKYRTFTPRVAFQDDKEMLERLVSGRANTAPAKNTLEILTTTDKNQLVVDSFFKTRNFKLQGAPNLVIPFIDFVNHSNLALPFDRTTKIHNERGMHLINCKPIEGDSQVYARYGKWDALDTYLMFGFASEFQAFVRSVPVKIELEGLGKLIINAQLGNNYKGKLPKEFCDLAEFFPAINKNPKGELVVSNLVFPNLKRPFVLKRILAGLVVQFKAQMPQQNIQNFVAMAEAQIIEKNLDYYRSLLSFFASKKVKYQDAPAFREAVKMAKIQIHEIEKYVAFFKEFAKTATGLESSSN